MRCKPPSMVCMAGEVLTVGVIADTHIPDRVNGLHPQVLPFLRAAGVSVILHAGDACVPAVLEELRQVAPVWAASGNRDSFFGLQLPLVQSLELAGVSIALMHGHGGFLPYWLDKVQYVAQGYRFERYQRICSRAAGQAQVVIFGHTHHPEVRWLDGRLWFNPGSSCHALYGGVWPSLGLLRLGPDGAIVPEIVPLTGYQRIGRIWQVKE